MKEVLNPKYSENEEKLNVLTHAFGLLMSSHWFAVPTA